MLEKLQSVENRYQQITEMLYDGEIVSDIEKYKSLLKEQKSLEDVVACFREYKSCCETVDECKAISEDGTADKDLRLLAQEEYESAKKQKEELFEQLKILLLPKDPNDTKNVIIEIRGGAGGEESALFAGVLFRMYCMYAESKKWKVDVLSCNETELGGYKEICFSVSGEGAYSRFKFESGVHRVQRVPETETGGRIHTSTATVAVLPEAEDVDIEISPTDLQIDTFRSSGAGGQHVNKTESAIRITYLPTGLVVECQDERSQHKNKERAMKILRSKILESERARQQNDIASERREQVGTGDRSERIRTYNFPQGRVSDHRIGLTIYKIESFINGDIDEIVDALITHDTAEKLKNQGEKNYAN